MLMQSAVAAKLRDRRRGVDLVDEEKLWCRLDDFLEKSRIASDEHAAKIARLRWFGGEKLKPMADPLSAGLGLRDEVEPDLCLSGVLLEAEGSSASRRADTVPAELHGKYAISISRKSGYRRPHLLGACHRSPGLPYADYELYDLRSSGDTYHDHRRQCWKAPTVKTEEADSSSSSSSGFETA